MTIPHTLEVAEWMGGLPFAELGGFIVPILCAILGGGGVWALLSARTTAKATERVAEVAVTPQVQTATTADWSALMSYWQAEMAALRLTSSQLEVRVLFLEREREEDLAHIDALEQHIWRSLPPPPPPRIFRKKPDTAP